MTSFRHTFIHIKQLPNSFWVVISSTFINQFGSMGLVFLIPYLTIHFKFSLPQGTFAYAVCTFSILLSGIVGGSLADRFGPARVMSIALILNGGILLGFPFLHHYLSILLMSFFWGFTLGVYRPASQTLLASLSRLGLYKITFSIYRLAVNAGMSIGPAFGGYLAMRSFSMIFIIGGMANIFGGLILTLGLIRKSWKNFPQISIPKVELGFKYLRDDTTLRLIAVGMIPISMVLYQHCSTLSIFFHRDLHFSLQIYGLMFSLNTLMIVFFELPLNIATLSWSARRCLVIGSCFITLGFVGYLLVSTPWEAMLCTVIWTTGEMIVMPTSSSYIASISPINNRGNYMSIYSTSTNLGMFLGPWIGGLVMHQFTSKGLWIACGLWGLCSILIFSFVNKQSTSR